MKNNSLRRTQRYICCRTYMTSGILRKDDLTPIPMALLANDWWGPRWVASPRYQTCHLRLCFVWHFPPSHACAGECDNDQWGHPCRHSDEPLARGTLSSLDPRARESTQRPSASCGAGRRTRPSQGRSHHARCLLRCWSPWLLTSAALLLLPNCIFWKHCQSFKTGFRLQVLDSVMCSWLLVMTNPASLCSVVDSFVYMLCSAKVCWSITWQLSSATKRQSSTPHLNDFKIIYIFLTVINSCMSCVYKPLLLRPRECIANYSIAASNYHYWFGHTSWPFWYI